MAASAKQELDYVASSLVPNTWQPLMAVGQMAMVLLSWLSVTLELFVRFNFGERYLSWLRLFLGLIIMELTTLVPRVIMTIIPFLGGSTPSLSPLFLRAAFCLGLYHQWCIWRRNRQGIAWHSNSFGVSRLAILPVSDWVLYRFIEPGICLVAGILIKYMDPVTGFWIILASVALFIKNQMVFNAQRGRVLDIVDARIESVAMQGALEGKSKRETAGYSVMPVPAMHLMDESTPDIAATVMATLNPAEQEVIAPGTVALIPNPEETSAFPEQEFQPLAFVVSAVTSDRVMSGDTVT